MTVMALDHVNIRTADIAGTAKFFADILDMTVRNAPDIPDMSQAAWIHDTDGRAAIHLSTAAVRYPWEDGPAMSPLGSGRVHHVALKCEGYEAMTRKLEGLGHDFHSNLVAEIGLRQLFIAEPNGILLELNFFDD